VPKALRFSEAGAAQAFKEGRLPLVLAARELDGSGVLSPAECEAHLVCDSLLEAKAAMEGQALAALLPDFLAPGKSSKSFVRVHIPELDSRAFHFYLAWNPRLLRLNPHATRMRDWLADSLAR
jgi:DNA-binding transcriptional LysR family regulator